MLHVLIVQLGCQDLLTVALASLDRYAGPCQVDIVKLPDTTTDPSMHGRSIDQWRQSQKLGIRDTDIVLVMDPDVVMLSDTWRRELDVAFSDPQVVMWGAGAPQWGPRIHAHMMAIRGRVFNELERSFQPCPDRREQTWRDTGGMYCMWASHMGALKRVPQSSRDWAGVAPCWRASDHTPLWAHLGGGSHSDVQRLNWRQRLSPWRRREIRKRKRFLAEARAHLTR